MMTPGERIIILRKKKGWTQIRLAEELGVSRSLISMVEAGARNPSVELYDGFEPVYLCCNVGTMGLSGTVVLTVWHKSRLFI